MGDVPVPVEKGPSVTDEISESLAYAAMRAAELGRTLLTGQKNGRVRRPVLFVLATVTLVAGAGSSASVDPLAIIGAIALVLLALTDAVVEVE